MKNLAIFVFLAIFMAFAATLSASIQEQTMLMKEEADNNDMAEAVKADPISFGKKDTHKTTIRGTAGNSVAKENFHFWRIHERIFGRKFTCSKNPKICLAKGSPGPFCCKNKCMNFLMDKENCGFCGKKCNFNEICCRGFCVKTLFGKKYAGHCGI